MLRPDLVVINENYVYLKYNRYDLEVSSIFKLHEYLFAFDTLNHSKKVVLYTNAKNNRFIFHPLFIFDNANKIPLVVVMLNDKVSLNTRKSTVLVNKNIITSDNKINVYIRKTYLKALKMVGYSIEYVDMEKYVTECFNSYVGINNFDKLLPIGFDNTDFFNTILKTRKKLVMDSLILNSVLLKIDVASYEIFDILDYNTIPDWFHSLNVENVLKNYPLEDLLELSLSDTTYIAPYYVPSSSLTCKVITKELPAEPYEKGEQNSSIQLDKNFIIIY